MTVQFVITEDFFSPNLPVGAQVEISNGHGKRTGTVLRRLSDVSFECQLGDHKIVAHDPELAWISHEQKKCCKQKKGSRSANQG